MGRDGGIIPARAGFTPPAVARRRGPWDHPRSRGVYPFTYVCSGLILGSSPLARGLQDTFRFEGQSGRIIPARAGFTRGLLLGSRRQRDHPRSRGVYTGPPTPARQKQGSSPLARGLHAYADADDAVARIIPARAGFTGSSTTSPAAAGDHPRSRGVYRGRIQCDCVAHGSSPLARGLPPKPVVGVVRTGIIPARAGFTGRPGACTSARTDHPRSRGVYSW